MHGGVAAHQETHDRVRVSASPDVPQTAAAMTTIAAAAGSAPVMMGGATPIDRGRMAVARSESMIVGQGLLVIVLAGIAGPHVRTMTSTPIIAGGICGPHVAHAPRSEARRGSRRSGAAQAIQGPGRTRPGVVGCGMMSPTHEGGAQAGQAAAIRAAAAWGVGASTHAIHGRCAVDWSPSSNLRRHRRQVWGAGLQSSSCC